MLQEAKNGGSGEDEKVRLTRIVGRGAMIGDHKHVEQLKLASSLHWHIMISPLHCGSPA